MPTYDYQCDACGHEFELFQNINASPKRKCPACRRFKLRRLFGTGAALVFKGSGFYQTDYRSDSYRKAAEADKPAAADGSSGAAKPAEAKSSDGAAPAGKSKPPARSKSAGNSKSES